MIQTTGKHRGQHREQSEKFDLEYPHRQDDHEDQQEHSTTDIHGPLTSFSMDSAGTAPAHLRR